MEVTEPNLGTTYPIDDSITVTNAGVYLVNFSMIGVSLGAATTTVSVRSNEEVLPALNQVLTVGPGINPFTGSGIVELEAEAVIDMVIQSAGLNTFAINPGGATLTVVRLS